MAALIRDRYEILETLGAGGEGRVVKALDHQHDRFVALKIRSVSGGVDRGELLSEARILLNLAPHPALPLAREDFFAGGEYFIAMDWVDGTDLARLLRNGGQPGLSPSSVLAYLAEAANALTFLHNQDTPIIHGDVKPGNLILTRGGRIKLVDFGMSSVPSAKRRREGTPGFRAPELNSGAAPSRATDIYSLAATAFTLLTGSVPSGVLPAWEGIDPEQAGHLEQVIRLGLSTDPTRRPETPGEFVERLRSGWAASLPTGVMTFCLTDIEGSTALWEQHPDAMASALVRHDDLIAQAVESHCGRFLKSMGEGDSTVSVFDTASHAMEAAMAACEALESERWPGGLDLRVRFGLHTGEAERRGTDYFGPTVNLASRLRGQADGGQIFLSSVSAELIGEVLTAEYSLVDLGPHNLRGLRLPERVFALAGPGLSSPLAATECPYRGLLSFEAADRRFFFGREEVLADLRVRLIPGALVAVVGASGSGKSSLLRAGLVAEAQGGMIPGVVSVELRTPGSGATVDAPANSGTLLVVDQFEELFTQCTDGARREAFISSLLAFPGPVVIGIRADFYGQLGAYSLLARAVTSNQILLGAMKATELRCAICEPARLAGLRLEPGLVDVILGEVAGEPGALPLLSHALRATWELRDGRTLTVEGYRDTGGVRSAIARTADSVVMTTPAESLGLLRDIFLRLTEIGDGVDETRRRVDIEDLVPEGGSRASVDQLLEHLADARLVTLGEGTAEVAHEALIREWPALRAWLEEDSEGLRLHRRLGDSARLWAAGGREESDLYRGTRLESGLEWAGGKSDALNATERSFLDASVELANREHAAQAQRINEQAQQMRHQARTNSRLRWLLGSAVLILVVATAAGGVALWQTGRANQQAAQARASAVSADADRIVAELPDLLSRDRTLGALLAVQAERLRPDPTTRGALLSALTQDPAWRFTVYGGRSGYRSLAAYPDGRRVAAMGPDGVDIWNLAARRRIGSFSVHDATSVAVSHDGGLIAVGTGSGTVVFRDARTFRTEGLPLRVGQPVSEIAFAPGRRVLAIAMQPTDVLRPVATTALLWDGVSRSAVPMALSVQDRGTSAVAFSPDGRLLATGDRFGNVVIRDSDGEPIGTPLAVSGYAYSMAFTDDNTRLAVGLGASGGVFVFDIRTHQMFQGPASGGETVVALRPHTTSLVVASNVAGTVVSRDVVTGQTIGAPILPQHGLGAQVAFLPGIGMVLSGSDGTLSVWDPTKSATIARLVPGSPLAGGLYSPDGSMLAISANDDTVRLYRTRDLHQVATLSIAGPGTRDPYTGPTPVAFSPDGDTVAIGDRLGDIQLFGVRTYHPLGPPRSSNPGDPPTENPPVELQFSPDGRYLVATSKYAGVPAHLLTLATGRMQALDPPSQSSFLIAAFSPDSRRLVLTGGGGATVFAVGHGGAGPGRSLQGLGASALSSAFSPNGRVLAVGNEDGTIRLFDANGLHPHGGPVTLSQGGLVSITFSPDSRLLVAQGTDGSNRLFDVSRRSPVGQAFAGSGVGFGMPGFAPDSKTVVLPGRSGTMLWDLNDDHWRARACALAGRQLTRSEWARYFSAAGFYRPTCGSRPSRLDRQT